MRTKPTARKNARTETVPTMPPVFCVTAPRRPRASTVSDQVAMLQFEIASLRDSHTFRNGQAKGTFEDKIFSGKYSVSKRCSNRPRTARMAQDGDKMRAIPNPKSGLLGLAMPPDSKPPAGMAVLLLYVPLDKLYDKNPLEIQADLGPPWAVKDGSTVWLDELVTK